MKKYVKPMMESEAFVANEFVSACYFVSCLECPGTLYSQTSVNADLISQGNDDYKAVYAYTGNLTNGKGNGCVSITEGGGKPKWIDDIYTGGWNLLALGWEELVWAGYQAYISWIGGSTSGTTRVYHPVNITDMKTIPGERHPNHS